jgi:ADP-ribose pyrophosphatase YjhB (NUDIX family)
VVAAAECAVPEGEDRVRDVCNTCGFINYVNPKMVVGCVIVDKKNRVLLARRAIEPRRGYWNLPAGYMEVGETVAQGAVREVREEVHADVAPLGLLCLLSIPSVSQVSLKLSFSAIARLASLRAVPLPALVAFNARSCRHRFTPSSPQRFEETRRSAAARSLSSASCLQRTRCRGTSWRFRRPRWRCARSFAARRSRIRAGLRPCRRTPRCHTSTCGDRALHRSSAHTGYIHIL